MRRSQPRGRAAASAVAGQRHEPHIKAVGGLSHVQDPREATHPVMPTRAIVEDDVDAVLPLDGIAEAIVALAHGRTLHDGGLASAEEIRRV